jgi:propionyl-CoA carboxylase alpha chain/3-methylcrotonyl-CoA carboxylase alpha subunit/acetyl-CoA/propionyl-CoA carboxylase biotin carboxyl carrier protein
MSGISKVLIANRGEIACRILRTLERLGIPGVIVCHPIDRDSPPARMASEVVEIAKEPPVAAYLDIDAIVDACRRSGADAVHPGFGFLAENAAFARRLISEGILFIGPLPDTIAMMGDKNRARRFCDAMGIPVIPAVSEMGAGERFLARAEAMGFPLLIKAAGGGGGKGMHIVREASRLEPAVSLASEEAQRYFGNPEVYAERFLENPRHIEVQVLADHHGNVLHLGERDCSIQRRFQKIVEESPAFGLAPDVRESILDSAVRIAQGARYQSAGTVEFLVDGEGRFYFLEMNTRIQVEHPVTEMITGLDLVEHQIRVAAGEPLPFSQKDIRFQGHAIEARIYAEDTEHDFAPSTGRLLRLNLPNGEGIRTDHALREGMDITPAFDPMLAKVIAHGSTRDRALEGLRHALEETLILGLATNTDFLKRLLSESSFREGPIHTGLIHEALLKTAPLERVELELLLAATALSSRHFCDPQFVAPQPYTTIGAWRS